MAIGHTDDASAGYPRFGLSNTYYGGVSGNITALVGIADTVSDNFSRDLNKERYDDILVPLIAIDDKIVDDYLEPIETKKQNIQQLGNAGTWVGAAATYLTPAAALNAISPIYQNCHTSNDNQACTVIGITTLGGLSGTVGVAVTQQTSEADPEDPDSTTFASGVVSISTSGASYLVVQDVQGEFVTGGFGSTTGFGDVTVGGVSVGKPSYILYTGMTKIREDVVMVTNYPNLEPPNSDKDNPWEGDTYPLLDNSTDGVGFAQTFFKNAIDTGAGGNPTISGAQDYGKVYTFDTTSASSVNNQIDTVDDEVVALRTGLSTYNNSSNVLKQIKIGYAVNIWSYDRGDKQMSERNDEFRQAIDVLNDPSIGGPY